MKINIHEMGMFHDIVLEATGESFPDQALDEIFNNLPDIIKQEVAEWGVSDTLVRDTIFDYLFEEDS